MRIRVGLPILLALFVAGVGCSSSKSDVPEPKTQNQPVLDAQPEPMPANEHVSGMDITSDPPMEVAVNGKAVGKSPVTVDKLPPGTYEVKFEDEKHGATTMVVELGEGEFKRVHHSPSPDASDARMAE